MPPFQILIPGNKKGATTKVSMAVPLKIRQYFQQWEWHWDHRIQSQREYLEGV
jgi:hypothetical protein